MKYVLLSLLSLTVILSVLVFYKYVNSGKNKNKMNIILISVDTLRADHMGVYGYEKDTTPNIDKWAKDAFIFTNAYTIMPITFHSFYTLFTGRDDVLKIENIANRYANLDKKSNEITTLPEILTENDFKTGAFITNPVIGDANLIFFKDGFQDFNYINTSAIKNKLPDIKVFNNDPKNAKEVTNKGGKWLKENKNKRFFLWLHYTTPHMPYNPSKVYLCKIDKNCDAEIYQKLLSDLSTTENGVLKSCTADEVSPEIINASKNLYDAEILSVNEQIGKILEEVERLRLSENTVIVFYADHGEGFEKNIFSHGDSLYNSGVRIPLIIKVPEKKSKTITHVLDNSDVLPSLLDLLQIKYDKSQITGKTFAPVFDDKKISSDKKYIYSIATTEKLNKRSIFDGTYKYIESVSDECLNNGEKEELYNLKIDPHETENIANTNEQIKKKLKNALFTSGIILENTTEPKEEIIDKLKSLGY